MTPSANDLALTDAQKSSVSGAAGQTAAHAIDHIGLVVRDADATVAWYREHFGLQVDSDEVLQEVSQEVRLIFLVPGTATEARLTALQLVSPISDGPIEQYLQAYGEGIHHVCFTVSSVRAALDELDDGVTVPFVGGKGRVCAFPSHVPGNVRLELVEDAVA